MDIVIIYGAPMSGKTTYAQQHIMNQDIVYDYDALAYTITNHNYQSYSDHVHDLLLTIRNNMIEYATWYKQGTMYIITTFLSKSILNRIELLSVNPSYIKMNTDKATCLNRLSESNREDEERIKQVIHDWYARYDNKPASDRVVDKATMRFYKSKAWRQTREAVLKRDNYECQACKRQGKVSTINKDKHKSLDVDHIKELDSHPELAYDMDNLETLCISCHNKKHNRYQKRWQHKKNKWADDEMW